jgi:hypothetical protein
MATKPSIEILRSILLLEVNRCLDAGTTLSFTRTEADSDYGITVKRVNGADKFTFEGYADYLRGTLVSVNQLPLHELAMLLDPFGADYSTNPTAAISEHELLEQRELIIEALDKALS